MEGSFADPYLLDPDPNTDPGFLVDSDPGTFLIFKAEFLSTPTDFQVTVLQRESLEY